MINKNLNNFIENALLEDIGSGDHSSIASINPHKENKAKLLIKDKGIIAGISLAKIIFNKVDPKLDFNTILKDGDKVNNGDIAFTIKGKTHSILQAERLVLNCMQNMSAIATKTNQFSSLISHLECTLLDTRKTTPLNRLIEKWAVRIGGGENHRFGLYDMIMIKDNHIDAAGGISNAIRRTKEYLNNNNKNLDIIVEVRNIKEVKEVLQEGNIKRILLDNFNYRQTKEAVKIINNKYEVESSGGITKESILEYAKCGVNFISVGELTNSLKNFDLSLKIF